MTSPPQKNSTDKIYPPVAGLNETRRDYPKDRCIHQVFAAQAARNPGAPALDFSGCRLTYRQLDEASTRWAQSLKEMGVGPDVPVGVYAEPSPGTMIAFLATLKAGGCYLPLDAHYPPDRIRFMLKDTGSTLVLSQSKFAKNIPEFRGRMVFLDQDPPAVTPGSLEDNGNGASAHHSACIFYTSGSTGRPKGVAVPHRAVNRLVCNTNYIHFRPADRVAQTSNLAFDGATFEIWGALLNGGCLVGCPKETLLSPRDLEAFLQRQEITVLFLTPAIFHQTAREVPGAFRSVRDLIMGGEVLDPRWVRDALKHGPPGRLINAYGPTEATTFATWHRVKDLRDDARSIPIGRPLANTTVYILGPDLEPVPEGGPGELFIGGDGLARGYVNRPAETAEKFIPHPFSDEPGARLYKTGDRACYRPDGNVEFLGRMDEQLKIRGFRIEPGEIEGVLKTHREVGEALVVAGEHGDPGDKYLAAYIVPLSPFGPTDQDLKNFLKDFLPDFMVPAFFIRMDRLPLNPNGKVDRSALPPPDPRPAGSEVEPPGDEVEERLIAIWEQLLGIRPLGVHDDFFALGGHSLLGAVLFTKLESVFGRKLPLSLLYQRPTIAQLAEVVRRPDSSVSCPHPLLVPINTLGSQPPFFWIQGKDALPVLKQSLGPDWPLYYLPPPMELEGTFPPYDSFEDLASRYREAIRLVQPQGPYFLGGFSGGALLAFETARQLRQKRGPIALLFLLDPSPPGNLPLVSMPWSFHLKKLLQIPFREKPVYLLTILKNLSQKMMGEVYRAFGYDLPNPLHGSLPILSLRSAIKNYLPGPFSDKTVLIKGNLGLEKNFFDWESLVGSQLEVHGLEADHTRFLKKPFIHIWAEHLRQSLLAAESRENSSARGSIQGPGPTHG